MAAGILVLVAQWAILVEITFDLPAATTIALGITGIVCSAVAVVYLKRIVLSPFRSACYG